MEERFCSKVKELGCTCVTISHRPALVAFHDLVLALDGEGGWSIHRGARAQSEGGQPELLDSGGSGPAGESFSDGCLWCLTAVQYKQHRQRVSLIC